MLVKHNEHRVVQGSDFTRDGLLNPNIKLEPIEVEDYGIGLSQSGHELSESEVKEAEEASAAAKHLANAKAGALKATAAFVDLTEMDDYEHQIFDGMVIFIDPTTGLDESPALSMKRFTFSNAHSASVPHHKHKLRTWIEGDCYQLIKLVCVQVRLTGRAQYNTIMAFGAITFRPPKTIDELINDLHVVKVKANRLRTHAIDDDTLKGALLTHCAGRPEYAQLA